MSNLKHFADTLRDLVNKADSLREIRSTLDQAGETIHHLQQLDDGLFHLSSLADMFDRMTHNPCIMLADQHQSDKDPATEALLLQAVADNNKLRQVAFTKWLADLE